VCEAFSNVYNPEKANNSAAENSAVLLARFLQNGAK
jgi:hypothetical protein